MKYRYEELARMIDHALLHPTMTDAEVKEGCRLADRYGVATVCVKPYHVPLACRILQNSGVHVSCVIGFPAGNSATETKVAEARLACQQGVAEIDMVINIGKALSGDFDYVENEIRAICDEAHSFRVKVKTIFETDYLPEDAIKIRLCEICGRAGADWVKTSTGFGFNKVTSGDYNYIGATEHDLLLMRKHSPDHVQVKASGGVRDLDGLIRVRDLGCTRLGTSATAAILDDYKRRETTESSPSSPSTASIGGGGY